MKKMASSRVLKCVSDRNTSLTSFRTKCTYCDLVARFYPYFGYCRVCGVKICVGCIKSKKLYIRCIFSDEIFDEFRCHIHKDDPPMRISMAMYNEMTDIVLSGKYSSDAGTSSGSDSSHSSGSSGSDSGQVGSGSAEGSEQSGEDTEISDSD